MLLILLLHLSSQCIRYFLCITIVILESILQSKSMVTVLLRFILDQYAFILLTLSFLVVYLLLFFFESQKNKIIVKTVVV